MSTQPEVRKGWISFHLSADEGTQLAVTMQKILDSDLFPQYPWIAYIRDEADIWSDEMFKREIDGR